MMLVKSTPRASNGTRHVSYTTTVKTAILYQANGDGGSKEKKNQVKGERDEKKT
jgi:hypothetical protein